MKRRDFLKTSAGLAASSFSFGFRWPDRPRLTHGVASGELELDRCIVWSRTDRPARLWVDWKGGTVRGQAALPTNDFTARASLEGLPREGQVSYRVRFESLERPGLFSRDGEGLIRPPGERFRLVWSGDTAGQGWGIDRARGGMTSYRAIAELEPNLFLHCGDLAYCDVPLDPERKLADGTVWRNLMTPAKAKVAEVLDDFRGNFRYNLEDDHVRGLLASTSVLAQWDDHEVSNDWLPGQMLGPGLPSDLLAAWAQQAFWEYNPLRSPDRIYRSLRYGPEVELFLLDLRSYRSGGRILGQQQARWLTDQVSRSQATWKIIGSEMPLGLVVGYPGNTDATADGFDGAPRGREAEWAEVLRAWRLAGVRNVVFLAADVHYAAAHFFHPERAHFREFEPFWEFIAGPLHAGNFGPCALDGTFGPEVVFQHAPQPVNQPPGPNTTTFGSVDLEEDGLRVRLHNGAGQILWERRLEAD